MNLTINADAVRVYRSNKNTLIITLIKNGADVMTLDPLECLVGDSVTLEGFGFTWRCNVTHEPR